MNLQENIQRIKEVMGFINESYSEVLQLTGGINWFSVNANARRFVIDSIENQTKNKIPSYVNSEIYDIFPKTDSDFFISFLDDIKRGALTQKSVDLFKQNLISRLQEKSKDSAFLDKIRKDIGQKNVSRIKNPITKPVINYMINSIFKDIGFTYFAQGLLNSVNLQKGNEGVDQKIVNNSNKIIKQIGNLISNDSQLKDKISSIVYSCITKL